MSDVAAFDNLTNGMLAEYGLMRLPRDADGVPVQLGDVMLWPSSGSEFTVIGIGPETLFYADDDGCQWTRACDKTHRRLPTVKNMLTEMLEGVVGHDGARTALARDVVDEYAEKLQELMEAHS